MIPPGPHVHSSIIRGIETALLDAAVPTEEPLLRRNARMTKSAEKMALRFQHLNLLTPNVKYSGRTAPLTSKIAFYIFIQQI